MINENVKRKIVENALEDARKMSGLRPEMKVAADLFNEYMLSEDLFWTEMDIDVRNKLYSLYDGLSRYVLSLEKYTANVVMVALDFGINGVEKSSKFLEMLLTNKINKSKKED